MYEMIYKALLEAGLHNRYCPQDYLNFFCLGNREKPSGEESSAAKKINEANKKEANTPQVSPSCLSQVSSRYLVFSHLESHILKKNCAGFGNPGTHSEEPALYDLCSFKRNDSGR